MGANVYLDSVRTLGYETQSASTVIKGEIDPIDGKRISVRAFGFTCGATATTVYVMQALGETTITTTVASGATTGFIGTAEAQTASNALASNDYIALELDNGKYHFTTVATGTYASFSIAAAITASMTAGAKVWGMGITTDQGGTIRYYLTASTSHRESVDGGIFYGAEKGYPMCITHANDAAAAGSIDYVTVDYINK